MGSFSQLSNLDLRKSLLELGAEVGPVTDSTRKVYETKLAKILGGDTASVQAQQSLQYEEVLDEDEVSFTTHNDTGGSPPKAAFTPKTSSSEVNNSSSPYGRSYYPSDKDLHRRPLRQDWKNDIGTPTATSTFTSTTITKSRKSVEKFSAKPKSTPFCRYLVYLLIVLLVVGLLIYIYMEPAQLMKLPSKSDSV